MNNRILYISLLLLSTMAVFSSCRDEIWYDPYVGEGRGIISAQVDFSSVIHDIAETRTSGDAIKEIKSLCVFLYRKTDSQEESGGDGNTTGDNEGTYNLYRRVVLDSGKFDITDNNGRPSDDGGENAETTTPKASFTIKDVDFGRYKIYVVANMDMSKYTDADLHTPDKLKSIRVAWDKDEIGNNNQMFGYFTTSDSRASVGFDGPVLTINRLSTKLHAWMRRLASKVTVSFDGSGLKDGISIYIKALRIKNIPASCNIGMNNTVNDKDNLIMKGEEVIYSESTSFDVNFPARIAKDMPFYPRVSNQGEDNTLSWEMDPNAHSEDNAYSLFFYENMQGNGPDKMQKDENKDGILDALYEYKDKPYATYVEVDAYYESTNSERPGICNITYRFMLGQDIRCDYNAKRNCHYKLTLCFNGFADEPDWRIDYVTRLWVTQPKAVDYRGKYFKPTDGISNWGNEFSNENIITVTSFMYERDSWFTRKPQPYKIEYKDAGSTDFTEDCPYWLDGFDTTDEGNGVYKLKIKYKNRYTSQNINATLMANDPKSGIYDLATKGGSDKMNTANCYIVNSQGTYQFPLVYGNAITDGKEFADSYTYKGTGNGVNYLTTFKNYNDKPITKPYILEDIYGKVVPAGLTASLVWQDASGLITDIQYRKELYSEKGGVQFTVGGGIKEGNAVIALKDPSGTIMWSWHIWVTAFDLSKIITLTNFDKNNFEIMPVNLGWCSGGIDVRYYERHECEVKFTQLIGGDGQEGISKTVTIVQEPHIALPCGNNPYYQWGRKDPFIAGVDGTTKTWYDAYNTPSASDPVVMYTKSDGTDRVETYKATASLIRNPHKWQNCPHQEPGLWGNPYRPKDNIIFNLWDNSNWDGNDVVIKTVYDPCPAGYHVSSIYTFSGFTDYGGSITNGEGGVDIRERMYAATDENMIQEKNYKDNLFEFYTNKTKLISVVFPQNGYRDWDNDAKLTSYGVYGYVWSAQATPFDWAIDKVDEQDFRYKAYHLEYNRYHHIWPWNNFYATDGFSIRPVRY